jgi:hypothetical protein
VPPAAQQQQACATVAEPWKAPREADSARDAAGAAQDRFTTGEAVRFSLHPDGEVAYRTLPQGEGDPKSFGGMASFTVERAGTYSVGLSEPIWVDVVEDGKPAQSIRFGPGAACSGIRKAVTFDLAAGEHGLELSGSTVPDVAVLITPVG